MSKIAANQYEKRTEFRLYSGNTDWLNWDNLKGTYLQIFNRHKNYLAVIYNDYIYGCLNISKSADNSFTKVMKTAKANGNYRYRGKELKKAIPVTKIREYDKKNPGEKQSEGLKKFDVFSGKTCNIEKAEKVIKMMNEADKKRLKGY